MTFVPEVAARHYIGGVHATEFHIKAGLSLTSDKHTQDHMGLVASGTAILKSPSGEIRLTGPAVVEFPAHTEHTLLTITDVVWFCIHRGKR